MGKEDQDIIEHAKKVAREFYNTSVALMVEESKGKGGVPDKVLKVTADGKVITKSDLNPQGVDFKDSIRCYYYYIEPSLKARTSGAVGAKNLTAEPACFYFDKTAEITSRDPIFKQSVCKVEIAELQEKNNKIVPATGWILGAATINSVITLDSTCEAIIVTFNKIAFVRYGINQETGDKEGIIERSGKDLITGEDWDGKD